MSDLDDRNEGWRSVLADAERAGTPLGRRGVGCLVIEGTRIHERALRVGAPVVRAVIGESFAVERSPRVRDLLAGLRAAGCRLFEAPDEVVRRAMGGRGSGAIVGLARLPETPPLADVLAAGAPSELLVALEIEDPGNVGALVRTALAAGAGAFVASGISDPFHPKAVRTSMGSVFKLPIFQLPGGEAVAALESGGVETWAAVSSGGEALPAVRRSERPVAVLLGSEAAGLPAGVAERADRRVTVPMASGVDSYSVNAAAAILLYELRRPR